MFLSKFLARNTNKSKLELLTEAWIGIQKYYETAADPLKDAVDLTPIPVCLQNIVKLIQAEELEYERASDSLETGPCLEYLLHKRVLEELVEFARVDTPFGMRIHCLRFFCSLVNNVHAQLLPERAVHVPLQKLINSCHRLISHHYEQMATEPESCPEERIQAISELSLELVKLMHGIFSHFKGSNAALMDLFFERGWCRGLGDNVWRSSKDGRTFHKRRESTDEKIAWNMFLTPRFDMFTYLIDYMNMPGETGEIAREAILFALRLLDGDPEYVCYVVEYSGLCEVMVSSVCAERLALFYAKLPKNTGAFTISDNSRVVPIRPPRRRISLSVPVMITNNSLMITVNTHHTFKKKRRKRSPFDVNFVRALESVRDNDIVVDEFYSFWEYLNDVARVADRRLMTALMAQLTTTFWHPVVCTALSSPSAELATAATAYTTEMIRSLTDQKLLHAFLVVLLGEEGGVGKDLEPETRSSLPRHDLIDDDHEEDEKSEEDEEEKEKDKVVSMSDDIDEDLTLRVLLINRIDADYHDLSVSTLRLFDTVLETYNQFAIYNLILRNYLDITPEGDYVDEVEKDAADASSLGSKTFDESAEKTKDADETEEEAKEEKSEEDAEADEANKKDKKTEKVRWLVERILSLLPLEDELERMKSPPLSSVIQSESLASTSIDMDGHRSSTSAENLQNVVVPGNSYDDYFHEARERFQYGLLAKNFWRTPYPPPKTKKDYAREAEHRRGRPQRRPMSMIVSSKDAAMHRNFDPDNGKEPHKLCGNFEGLFMSRIFDQFFKLMESSMEQNLLVTSILQKIVGVVDKRVDGVICEWRAVRIGGDGALYGGVWTLPSAKGNRRSLYSLLEQVTFEALKRAQLVPNFETRISIAKKRGVLHGTNNGNASNGHHHQGHGQQPQLKRSASSFTRSPTAGSPREQGKLSRHPSLSQLVFSKNSPSPSSPLSPGSPSKSTSVLPPRKPSREGTPNGTSGPNSPSAMFFQQSQRANATPVTMTNPFAKLSNFVNSYIVLQEFCKELAAVILVRHATNYNETGLVRYQQDPRGSVLNLPQQDYWFENEHRHHQQLEDEYNLLSPADSEHKPSMDKWKNRISMVSTLADWRSVRSLDIIDEAITARVRSASSDGKW
ncbi:Retinoic acid induced 16-like protein-domain-containing protein [Zychaea mexicana]|uniref:Retinoic acid induced 16-like protein-domain-containing protein n=1 Tax=Zychaea mexicana TaxID=64656 RepID=UPI0022FE108E|nr:Retinoic acid induced 16-like protein-domain-containing protein [Zychaea mexicana]KAI9485074.1 Retinoic acid induced 16-like protein-domain-containing protein [Zychaea mexicana]